MTKNIITQERFEAWLFSQPDEREYKYFNTEGCLICDFIKENTSNEAAGVGGDYYRVQSDHFEKIPFEPWLLVVMTEYKMTKLGGLSVPICKTFKQVKAIYEAFHGNPADTLGNLKNEKRST